MTASAQPAVCVIAGPTAAGKSALAMALAGVTGAVVVSADSRQVYRGFDIGTAKPSAADRAAVPHRGIDVAEPTDRWHAARWADAARAWIADARAESRPVLVVGGTGLWIRALAEPLFDEPPLDPAARAALAHELEAVPTPELRARVERLDPPRAHLGRAQLLRALEVVTLTGRPQSEWMARPPKVPGMPLRYCVVDPGPVLADRIAARCDAMLAAGWVDEAVRLRATVPPTAPAWKATGYEHVLAVAQARCTRREARERIVIATRQYAKRQRTWFRHQLPAAGVLRLSPDDPGTIAAALRWFREVP